MRGGNGWVLGVYRLLQLFDTSLLKEHDLASCQRKLMGAVGFAEWLSLLISIRMAFI